MNIALIGYGKMGRMIEQITLERGHKIVCVVDIDNHNDINSDAFRSADVAIEFTAPTSAYQNVKDAFAQDVKVVSGSTGWMNEHGDEMKKLCEQGLHTLFWSSNFSVGVALFNALNTYLAKLMNKFPSYDVKIEETHHIHKLDAPSGTAITLAEGVISGLYMIGEVLATATVVGGIHCIFNGNPVIRSLVILAICIGECLAVWKLNIRYLERKYRA